MFWTSGNTSVSPATITFTLTTRTLTRPDTNAAAAWCTLVFLHGLEFSSNNSLSVDLATAYLQRGFETACLNFLGCCDGPEPTPGAYHLGFSDNLYLLMDVLTNCRRKQNKRGEGNDAKGRIGPLPDTAVDRHDIAGAAVTGAPSTTDFGTRKLRRLASSKLCAANTSLPP